MITMRTLFAIGNFIGRFASGLVVVMPVLLLKCKKQNAPATSSPASSNTSCFGQLKKFITVRAVYCIASFVLCATFLVIAVSASQSSGQPQAINSSLTNSWNATGNTNLTSLSNETSSPILTSRCSPGWITVLMLTFFIVGISAGCLFSQFPVVLAELVGLQRLAAGHALFMLAQVPVSGLHTVSGIIKSLTGSWGVAYIILFFVTLVITILNSVSLLLGDHVRRLLCRTSARQAAGHA